MAFHACGLVFHWRLMHAGEGVSCGCMLGFDVPSEQAGFSWMAVNVGMGLAAASVAFGKPQPVPAPAGHGEVEA